MNDLKASLASLQLNRDAPAPAGRSRWIVWVACLAALSFGVVRYGKTARTFVQSSVRTFALAAPTVETTAPVVTGGAVSTGAPILTASGYVVARRKAIVSAKIQGRLARLDVEEGAHVREGQVIARLEDSEFRAQAQRARASVGGAKANLDEQERLLAITERLVAQNAAPANDREVAQSRVSLALAALSQARAEVTVQDALQQSTLIRAPFAGTVVKKMAEVGESVAPLPPGANISTSTGAIVAIADVDTLEVEADIGEANLAKLHPDQPAQVVADAFPNAQFKAVLRTITPIADRTKATVLVHVTIKPDTSATRRALKPEMAAKVTFLEPRADSSAPPPPRAVLVSRGAVAKRGGEDVVFEVRADHAHTIAVSLGDPRGDLVAVKSGLAGTELLVASPSDSLKDGDAVKVKP